MSEYNAELTTVKIYDVDKKVVSEKEVLCETGDSEGTLRLKVLLEELKANIEMQIANLELRIEKLEVVKG